MSLEKGTKPFSKVLINLWSRNMCSIILSNFLSDFSWWAQERWQALLSLQCHSRLCDSSDMKMVWTSKHSTKITFIACYIKPHWSHFYPHSFCKHTHTLRKTALKMFYTWKQLPSLNSSCKSNECICNVFVRIAHGDGYKRETHIHMIMRCISQLKSFSVGS